MASEDFLIVGLGASAGGIKAFREFFQHVPDKSGAAYVVILHLSPEHESRLAEVLQVVTSMPVRQVHDRVHVQPDHVYVIPPSQSLGMVDGYLALSPLLRLEERRAPIDIFFRTLGEAHGRRAVTVVLSGTGADGSMGMKRVKECGGVCFVQDPEEAEHGDMPRACIATALVDQVLEVARIPERIVAYYRSLHEIELPDRPDEPIETDDEGLREIFSLLRQRTGHDFTNYKRSTVLRRIERRLGVHGIRTVRSYAQFIRDHPTESQALLKDLLISVTNFFRDRDAFEKLEELIVPRLFQGRTEDDQVRVWVPGCATGEEAYSLAMLLAERSTNAPGAPAIQVFATDIDEAAIATAREGTYTINDAADVSPERLERFFIKTGDVYRVRKELRDIVLFAHHNLIKDSPFSHLDLVSCRNLLIYLNRTAQQRVMDLLHFALNPGGYLFLGSSEAVDGASDLFLSVDKDAHIFQSRPVGSRLAMPIPDLLGTPRIRYDQLTSTAPEARVRERLSYADLHQRLLEEYAPPSVIVNEEHEILHLSERAGRYLHFAGGEPSHNLLRAVRPELRIELRSALYLAAQDKAPVEARGLTFDEGGTRVTVDVSVRPVLREDDVARGFFLVVFREATEAERREAETPVSRIEPAVHLEQELVRLKTQLRATIDQHDTQAEELKASNQELQAMNEELRSSAEELETSKEELQSVNEELTTVNQELKIKVEEQAQANNDIQNLINSSDIGAIFLDRSGRIKLFTPRMRDTFSLIAGDRGRPLTDITTMLVDQDLPADVARVLERLERVEREVATRDGRWHLMRALPYRTAEDRIDGVVLTFVDITERRRTEERLRQSEARLSAIVEQSAAGIASAGVDGRLTFANRKLADLLGYSPGTLLGVSLIDLVAAGERQDIEQQFTRLTQHGLAFQTVKPLIAKTGATVWANLTGSAIRDESGVVQSAVLVLVDVTETRRAEAASRLSDDRLRLVVESVKEYFILTIDPRGIFDGWTSAAARAFGYTEEEAIGQHVSLVFTEEDRKAGVPEQELQTARDHGVATDERWHRRKDGSLFYVTGTVSPLLDAEGKVTGFVKIARDLTERKQYEDALRQAHDVLEDRVLERTRDLELEIRERRANEGRVRRLLQRLVTVQEDERRRIARDLHDHLGQQMTALRLNLAAIKDRPEDRAVAELAQKADELAEQLDADVDFLAWELRPAALDDVGLADTLRRFVQEWSSHYGISVDFHTAGLDGQRLPAVVETNLYRIAQEAMNNVYKHARASHVDIILERRGPQVVLILEDDGVGFDAAQAAEDSDGKELGLSGMRERATLVGGTLDLETTAGKGTTVFVRVPSEE